MELPERFWKKVQKDEQTGCWLWAASKTHNGYGAFSIQGRTQYAHRLAYEELKGPIPNGLQLDHLCRNRECCNPEHLEAVTQGENVRRGNSWMINGTKTHCSSGHPFSPDNTRVTRRGRVCKACVRISSRDCRRARSKSLNALTG